MSADQTEIVCGGHSHIGYFPHCPSQPIWVAGEETVCGLHLARSIRMQIEDGAKSVTVRRMAHR